MADFSPNKIDLTQINGGKRYVDGDIPNAEGINAAIEASAYAQDKSEEANGAATSAVASATAAENAAASAAASATQAATSSGAAQTAANESAMSAGQAAASASTAQAQATSAAESAQSAAQSATAAQTAASTANSNATSAVNTANAAKDTANAAKAASDTATAKVAELSEQIIQKQGTKVSIDGVAQESVELTTATVGKAETLTEPFVVGKDTAAATTGYVKFASVSLPAAYRSATARFEVLDKNPANAQTQMCGLEVVVKNTSTTVVNVVPRLLYGSSAYLSKIYACVKEGAYPVLVDLYFDITSSNPQESISCIKPIFTFTRVTGSTTFTFVTDNVVVTDLPTDTTNTQLFTSLVLVTEAADSAKLNGKAASEYALVNGTYDSMTVGKAIADSDGNDIPDTYAKKNEIKEVPELPSNYLGTYYLIASRQSSGAAENVSWKYRTTQYSVHFIRVQNNAFKGVLIYLCSVNHTEKFTKLSDLWEAMRNESTSGIQYLHPAIGVSSNKPVVGFNAQGVTNYFSLLFGDGTMTTMAGDYSSDTLISDFVIISNVL